MKNIFNISRIFAEKFSFDLSEVEEALEDFNTELVEGVDYEWGFVRGDDFPSSLIILNEEKKDEIKSMLVFLKSI